jgi:hypothetical protein
MKKLLFSLFTLTTLGAIAQHDSGVINLGGGVSIRVQTTATTVTLTAAGPSDRWFSVGFGTQDMEAGDCIIFDSTGLSDRHFIGGGQVPATDTNQWTVSSNNMVGMVRTIIATRALSTGDATDFVFTNSTASIPVVWARHQQASNNLAWHGGANRGSATVPMALGSELYQFNDLSVFPIPAIDELNVSLPEISSKFQFSIYEISGKLMLTGVLEQALTVVDVKSLSSGSYVIHISNEEIGSTSKTFIKK